VLRKTSLFAFMLSILVCAPGIWAQVGQIRTSAYHKQSEIETAVDRWMSPMEDWPTAPVAALQLFETREVSGP